ncbi:ureidoglycolate lyase [Xanthobacter sp. YC-JY1]|uniref:ureidoglycolate lyase n=1 Tax=Xanthobacter sp. YC-JY1 TaxID=2419844 RepID=UPI001F3B9819|nr:ureidoglycolate lyase [Xanthobacter sp. YC-JY1]
MRPLVPRPLTAAAFAPYGEVFAVPETVGVRTSFDKGLANLKPDVPASLSIILASPVPQPVAVEVIERHVFTSQSFVPMAAARWVIVVAPGTAEDGPDLTAAEAFLPAPGQGITLAPGTWHAPLTVLDAPAPFALLMWRDYGPDDEEVIPIPAMAVAL